MHGVTAQGGGAGGSYTEFDQGTLNCTGFAARWIAAGVAAGGAIGIAAFRGLYRVGLHQGEHALDRLIRTVATEAETADARRAMTCAKTVDP